MLRALADNLLRCAAAPISAQRDVAQFDEHGHLAIRVR